MAKGKNYKNNLNIMDRMKEYELVEAISLLKEMKLSNFDESVDIAVNLGVDPRHADQLVRGTVSLPNGTGKNIRVVVLTKDDENAIYVKTYFPNDNRIIYQSDIGGNELDHVYVLDNDGNIKDLTPGNNLKASFSGWSEDDLYFYIETNERDPRYFDLYRYNVNGYGRKIIF